MPHASTPSDGYTILDGFEPGKLVAGRYRILETLGRGGMGVVLRAHHLELDRAVAIKVLRHDIEVDKDTIARFLREARAASLLANPHVVRIFEVGQLSDGLPYIAMELLDGVDLGRLLGHGPIAPPRAVAAARQACDALGEAHVRGIIHRDLKPSNLFVTRAGMLKVLDFGLAKASDGVDIESLTKSSAVLGTPGYMSPEQMRSSRTVDARSDIWSLGVVLYELVEGRRPFHEPSFAQLCIAIAAHPPAAMRRCPALSPIVMRCLAKDPDGRFRSVVELASALDALEPAQLVEIQPVLPTTERPTRTRPTRPSKRRSSPAVQAIDSTSSEVRTRVRARTQPVRPKPQSWLVVILVAAIAVVCAGIALVAIASSGP